jgi:hypothetical protein
LISSFYAPIVGIKDLRRIIRARTRRNPVIINPITNKFQIVPIGRKYHTALTISIKSFGIVIIGMYIDGTNPTNHLNRLPITENIIFPLS